MEENLSYLISIRNNLKAMSTQIAQNNPDFDLSLCLEMISEFNLKIKLQEKAKELMTNMNKVLGNLAMDFKNNDNEPLELNFKKSNRDYLISYDFNNNTKEGEICFRDMTKDNSFPANTLYLGLIYEVVNFNESSDIRNLNLDLQSKLP